MKIDNILKPKSKQDIKQAALRIENPDKLLKLACIKLNNIELVVTSLNRGADPNYIMSDIQQIENHDIIKLLLKNSKTDVSVNSLIYKSLKLGFEDEIIDLISNHKLDPSEKKSILFVWAVGFNKKKLATILLKDKRIDFTEEDTIIEALAVAIARQGNDLVKMLLKDDRIDPSFDDNRALRVAENFNNAEIEDILNKDPRVIKIKNKK